MEPWMVKAALVIGALITVDIALFLAVRSERVRQVHRARRGMSMGYPVADPKINDEWARRPRW